MNFINKQNGKITYTSSAVYCVSTIRKMYSCLAFLKFLLRWS